MGIPHYKAEKFFILYLLCTAKSHLIYVLYTLSETDAFCGGGYTLFWLMIICRSGLQNIRRNQSGCGIWQCKLHCRIGNKEKCVGHQPLKNSWPASQLIIPECHSCHQEMILMVPSSRQKHKQIIPQFPTFPQNVRITVICNFCNYLFC